MDFTHDDEKGVRTTARTVWDTNLKIGLLNNVDLQIVTHAYSEEETDPDTGPSVTLNGIGDVQLRVKVNLWGNDSGDGDTAFGVMPFVKIPTGGETSNDKIGGGMIWMLGCRRALGPWVPGRNRFCLR